MKILISLILNQTQVTRLSRYVWEIISFERRPPEVSQIYFSRKWFVALKIENT